MVSGRMGLLDDAIREHLELKRQRGADPSEVAREQHEALDAPVQGTSAEDAALAADTASAGPLVDPPAATAPPDTATAADVSANAASPGQLDASSDTAVAGETAELDMSSVLGEEHDDTPRQAPTPDASTAQEDSLEWEMPGEAAAADGEAEESAEDVLEETPEFLRDTPEQERLWFEQRPPRDFDFDK
jgi:hypothetical protein